MLCVLHVITLLWNKENDVTERKLYLYLFKIIVNILYNSSFLNDYYVC